MVIKKRICPSCKKDLMEIPKVSYIKGFEHRIPRPEPLQEAPFTPYVCPECGLIQYYSTTEKERSNPPVEFGIGLTQNQIKEKLHFKPGNTEKIYFIFKNNSEKQEIWDATFDVLFKSGLALSGDEEALTVDYVSLHGRVKEGPYIIRYQLPLFPKQKLFSPWVKVVLPDKKRVFDITITFSSASYNSIERTVKLDTT